ncbi:TetR/AcrR family transcriptional regulator [Aurantivibrio plasticivorans]
MANAAKHRDNLVNTAIKLFRTKGYAATGLNDILSLSGAPKGSLYHYFPAGKEQLACECLEVAGNKVSITLKDLANNATSPEEFISEYCSLLSGWMHDSAFTEGCPITTVLLECAPNSPNITVSCEKIFNEWLRIIECFLKNKGRDDTEAEDYAEFILSAIEGALILARVQRSAMPLARTAKSLALLVS